MKRKLNTVRKIENFITAKEIKFENRRQTAESLIQIATVQAVANYMGISRRGVWMHCTTHCARKHPVIHLI